MIDNVNNDNSDRNEPIEVIEIRFVKGTQPSVPVDKDESDAEARVVCGSPNDAVRLNRILTDILNDPDIAITCEGNIVSMPSRYMRKSGLFELFGKGGLITEDYVRLTNGTFELEFHLSFIENILHRLQNQAPKGLEAIRELYKLCRDSSYTPDVALENLLDKYALIKNGQISDKVRNFVLCAMKNEQGPLENPRDTQAPEVWKNHNPHAPCLIEWYEKQFDPIKHISENAMEYAGGLLPVWTSDKEAFGNSQQPVRRHVERVVITLNGMLRDNEPYGQKGLDAITNEDGKTLVISPGFLSPSDKRTPSDDPVERFLVRPEFKPNYFTWREDLRLEVNEGGWKHGYNALSPRIAGQQMPSSFELLDEIVKRLVNLRQFPNLKEIVIAGNSAGAQMGECYALVGKAQDIVEQASQSRRRAGRPAIGLGFVESNSSNHPYLTASRHAMEDDKLKQILGMINEDPSNEIALQELKRTFAQAEAQGKINGWPFGLDGPLPPYAEAAIREYGKDRLIERYLGETNLAILTGTEDNTKNPGLRVDPASMSQGIQRLERGDWYEEHLQEVARSRGIVLKIRRETIGRVGHNAGDLWKTD